MFGAGDGGQRQSGLQVGFGDAWMRQRRFDAVSVEVFADGVDDGREFCRSIRAEWQRSAAGGFRVREPHRFERVLKHLVGGSVKGKRDDDDRRAILFHGRHTTRRRPVLMWRGNTGSPREITANLNCCGYFAGHPLRRLYRVGIQGWRCCEIGQFTADVNTKALCPSKLRMSERKWE